MQITRRELIAVLDFKVDDERLPLNLRLEIYETAGTFEGTVYRSEHYRIQPTFPQNGTGIPCDDPDDALLFVRDAMLDGPDLRGRSREEVVRIFEAKLGRLFGA